MRPSDGTPAEGLCVYPNSVESRGASCQTPQGADCQPFTSNTLAVYVGWSRQRICCAVCSLVEDSLPTCHVPKQHLAGLKRTDRQFSNLLTLQTFSFQCAKPEHGSRFSCRGTQPWRNAANIRLICRAIAQLRLTCEVGMAWCATAITVGGCHPGFPRLPISD